MGRLPSGSIWATPLAVKDGVYFFGKNGTTSVIATGSKFKLLAKNELWANEPSNSDGKTSKAQESDLGTAVLYAAISSKSKLLLRRGDVVYAVE